MPISTQIETAIEEDRLAFQARSDPDAFGILYQRYVRRVYRYLYSQTGCVEDAEDLTEQVFTAVVEGLARYQPQGNFAGWLFTIARRRALNARRNQRVLIPLEGVENRADLSKDVLEQVIATERLRRLVTLVRVLGPDEIELLRLRFQAELTYRQIGRLIGKREAAVAMAMHRLLQRLRARWEEADDES